MRLFLLLVSVALVSTHSERVWRLITANITHDVQLLLTDHAINVVIAGSCTWTDEVATALGPLNNSTRQGVCFGPREQIKVSGLQHVSSMPTFTAQHIVAVVHIGKHLAVHMGQAVLLGQLLASSPRVCLSLHLSYNKLGALDTAIVTHIQQRNTTVLMQSSSEFKHTFSAVYSRKIWGTYGGGSGLGSSPKYTAHVRAALPPLIAKYGISSLLDSSCGSMAWIPAVIDTVRADIAQFRYMGVDVVCDLIAQHKQTFESRPDMQFACLDYSRQALPRGYDLVLSRDSLQHVPFRAVLQFLNNVRSSGARFLLVGSYLNTTANTDIAAGQYAPLNLQLPPFELRPAPLEVVAEGTADGKYLLLYEVARMQWQDELEYL